MFDYEEMYRVEAEDTPYPIVDGAALTGTAKRPDGREVQLWLFWAGPRMDHPAVVPFDLYDVRKEGAFIRARREGFHGELLFVPLLLEWVWDHPEDYEATAANVREKYPTYEALEVLLGKPTGYELEIGPIAQANNPPLGASAVEASAAETMDAAPVGAIRVVSGSLYEKQKDGLWIKVEQSR